MLIETPRLILREYTPDDFSSIYKVLADREIMQHYPYVFDEERVRDWAFQNTKYDKIYSWMKYTNEASWRTAMKIGMKKEKEYPDEVNGISYAFAITREEWEKNNGRKQPVSQ